MTEAVTTFHFYLDAWTYCHKHGLDSSLIKRRDWKTWEITLPETNDEW